MIINQSNTLISPCMLIKGLPSRTLFIFLIVIDMGKEVGRVTSDQKVGRVTSDHLAHGVHGLPTKRSRIEMHDSELDQHTTASLIESRQWPNHNEVVPAGRLWILQKAIFFCFTRFHSIKPWDTRHPKICHPTTRTKTMWNISSESKSSG